jgi:hypothetical protein
MKFKLLHFISVVFICAIFLGAAGQAAACLCPNFSDAVPLKEHVKAAKADATAVFTGQVISIDPVEIEGTGGSHTLPDGTVEFILPQYERLISFKITDVWKGDVVYRIKMRDLRSGCDFPFETGNSYLVYAYGKVLTTTICSRTALIGAKNTRKEIKILNKLKDRSQKGSEFKL